MVLFRGLCRLIAVAGALLVLSGCAGVYPGPEAGGTTVLQRPVSTPKVLPPELKPLTDVKVLTRGGLAALLMVELPLSDFQVHDSFPIVVDVSEHWARKEILTAVQLGLIPVFANHRFQPDLPVSRGEMAQILDNILKTRGLAAMRRPIPDNLPRDLPRGHLAYAAVRRVLEAGVMDVDASGHFAVSDTVSGPEASGFLRKIRSLM
jgi:hypothetical protein